MVEDTNKGSNPSGVDAFKPAEIARLVEDAGVAKAHLPLLPLTMLGVLAGAFIAFGGMFYTLVMSGAGDAFGPMRLLGGVAFSLGLILVIVAGAELFTGNALIIMGWVDRRISTRALVRNWTVVYIANLVGSLAMVALFAASGCLDLGGGLVGKTAAAIATGKLAIPPFEAFMRGILCNILVCLAVWLTFASHNVIGKIFALLWPVTAFVALGFEHSIANMYLIPIGLFAGAEGSLMGVLGNLLPVTLGNIIGGAGGVALSYRAIYLVK